mmetsp:Transcript_35470/g.72301  ORF Transcript_35470/g.72301 Transcript_35470/m.72301 type:complete len:81 (-) Transcript_35470:109-351(-)
MMNIRRLPVMHDKRTPAHRFATSAEAKFMAETCWREGCAINGDSPDTLLEYIPDQIKRQSIGMATAREDIGNTSLDRPQL